MAGAVLLAAQTNPQVPQHPPVDMAVAANFERFGLTQTPSVVTPGAPNVTGSQNRPGAGRYDGPVVFTRGFEGTVAGVTLGAGQAAMPEGGQAGTRIFRAPGRATFAHAPSIQLRMGVGQHGPSSLGVAQTVALATITRNPPASGTIFRILSGQG